MRGLPPTARGTPAVIDIYKLYRSSPEEGRKPFNRFFESKGYVQAFEHLRYDRGLDEGSILKRSRGSIHAPATARVHPLVALEFVRWMNYGVYVDLLKLEAEDLGVRTEETSDVEPSTA